MRDIYPVIGVLNRMTAIPDNLLEACEEDVSFIDEEIGRFHQLHLSGGSFEEQFGSGMGGILELSATLKHHLSGAECRCGRLALRRFTRIAERLVQAQKNPDSWDISVLHDQLRTTFLSFMTDEKFDNGKGAISAWLLDSLHRVQQRHRSTTHYVPCVALQLGTQRSYPFGPVTFVEKSSFFATHEVGLDSYERARERLSGRAFRNATPSQQECLTSHSSEKRIRSTEAFRNFTEGFPWIAVVKVGRCDHSVAEMRADEAVRIALASTKLLLNPSEGAGLRSPDDPVPLNTRQRLSSHDGRMFRTSGSWQFGTPREAPDWLSYLETVASDVLAVCQQMVRQATNGTPRTFAYQIALRAIRWYADAVSDPNEETKVFKCVTALECILLPTDGAATAIFSIRGALLAQRKEDSFENCTGMAKTIYARRSDIAHGNVKALSAAPSVASKDILDFVRRSILQFLVFCNQCQPMGSERDGTREQVLHFYGWLQNAHANEIEAVVVKNNWEKSWKKILRQK